MELYKKAIPAVSKIRDGFNPARRILGEIHLPWKASISSSVCATALKENPSQSPGSCTGGRPWLRHCTWMLDVTSTQMKQILGVEFVEY
jgi:hypothetical protein